jgi:hypothetical protein
MDHGIAFQSQPFLTRMFPATRSHVLVVHGLDNGRRDDLGSFSFGAGRTLSKTGERLFSSFLVNTPWSVEAATAEVPLYASRIFVQGDWRVDALREFAKRKDLIDNYFGLKPNLATIGLYTTHGEGSAFRWLSKDLIRVLTELSRSTNVMMFFHPLERQNQPDLFLKVRNLCAQNKRIRIIEKDEIEQGLSACQLLVGDMSSLSLYFSILSRPILFTPFEKSQLTPGFPGEALAHESTMLTAADELIDMIKANIFGSASDRLPIPSLEFRERLYPSGLCFANAAPIAIRSALTLASLEQ